MKIDLQFSKSIWQSTDPDRSGEVEANFILQQKFCFEAVKLSVPLRLEQDEGQPIYFGCPFLLLSDLRFGRVSIKWEFCMHLALAYKRLWFELHRRLNPHENEMWLEKITLQPIVNHNLRLSQNPGFLKRSFDFGPSALRSG